MEISPPPQVHILVVGQKSADGRAVKGADDREVRDWQQRDLGSGLRELRGQCQTPE